jgi:hypothetical protein
MAKRISSHLADDEITTRGYSALTFAKCTTIMIVKLAITRSLGSSRDYMVFGNGMVRMVFGVAYVESCDP